MKILFLTRYGTMGASSRYRSMQYLPYLQAHGFEITFSPLLDDAYLTNLYAGNSPHWWRVARAYLDRIVDLQRSARYDLVWIEKELFPMVPGAIESLIQRQKIPYVVDYDDAIFHNYDRHRSPAVRRLMGHKIDDVMRRSSLVIAGNPYIASRARAAGAPKVEILPTVVRLQRYRTKSEDTSSQPLVIGWIGTSTTAPYLHIIEEALREVSSLFPIKFVVIGPRQNEVSLAGVPIEYVPWSEATEVDSLRRLDVGVMPLLDSPWERGKCGLKLIQYMACGLPVVASPVGVNTEIVEPGGNGFLCATTQEWVEALKRLHVSSTYRKELGDAGRRKVEDRYTLADAAPRLAGLLSSAARQRR